MKSHKIEKHTPKSSKVTLYYCEICAIEFDKVENLKTHRREEQCSNIYHCEICDLNFDEVENLKTHKKSHCSEIRFLAIFYLEQPPWITLKKTKDSALVQNAALII